MKLTLGKTGDKWLGSTSSRNSKKAEEPVRCHGGGPDKKFGPLAVRLGVIQSPLVVLRNTSTNAMSALFTSRLRLLSAFIAGIVSVIMPSLPATR